MKKKHTIMPIQRRVFLQHGMAVCASYLVLLPTHAQVMLTESDPQAKGLGYVTDAAKVDRTLQPKFKPNQACKNCRFYKGASDDSTGGCTLFANKRVSASGWCSAYQLKNA